jgi:hypothetical protein
VTHQQNEKKHLRHSASCATPHTNPGHEQMRTSKGAGPMGAPAHRSGATGEMHDGHRHRVRTTSVYVCAGALWRFGAIDACYIVFVSG